MSTPLTIANSLYEQQRDFALLYSGMQTTYSGRYSYLAFDPVQTIQGNSFSELEAHCTHHTDWHQQCWFGYMGYELAADTEKHLRLNTTPPSPISMPNMWMVKYRHIIRYDHVTNSSDYFGPDKTTIPEPSQPSTDSAFSVANITSNMDKQTYLTHVKTILNAIKQGDLYQANLTRKWFGHFHEPPNSFALFAKLCHISPAPYSAFLSHGDYHILSSSPERFLSVSSDGHVNTRPIKGSAKRSTNTKKDSQIYHNLAQSEKDKAENLMIVDLMRNDLARTCEPGSIEVDKLFQVDSYATIHHMSSSINAIKSSTSSTLELIKQCFAPGSMTGTPKIKAMQLCQQLENIQRGVYSGAIGYIGADGSCDLSVVIRTLLIHKNQFEFQTGGAIVADSTPNGEWAETITKATAICKLLNIKIDE